MHHKTLAELATGLAAKEFSSVELTRHFLNRIRQHDGLLNSFITVCDEQALAQAAAADATRAAGKAGLLTGVPMAQKDIFCTEGVKTTCASKMLDSFISPYNAAVIERSLSAGLVMLGKTNMDEFAMGSSNETSFYGPVKNPWDTTKVP
ncbi:MAG: amidase, partial [Moraxellaceae bacterium]